MTPSEAREELRLIAVRAAKNGGKIPTAIVDTVLSCRDLVRDAYGMTEETEYQDDHGRCYTAATGYPEDAGAERTVWREREWRGVETT